MYLGVDYVLYECCNDNLQTFCKDKFFIPVKMSLLGIGMCPSLLSPPNVPPQLIFYFIKYQGYVHCA